ncbi:MAG TPA: preprotein translocase subunit SecG [Candidatus Alistipes avicola]|uniref:Protein-export membrane protein SecG n=1 Tax=Candidatus Alistipes avicola TaxID=2838432 RepID=A0A9D2L558_9BACT|nr:preprotein translocase subunit SecG [uncultured Alistipes sp.]HJA99505.1 preprotein translocase subunit SecG [Candidatus Alistipes avicola]
MLYTLCIILILVASVLIILAVLVQNPKSGMAANFGVSNQVMGVRQTTNFLEKFTWTMAVVIVVLSLVATMAMDRGLVATSNAKIDEDAKALMETVVETDAVIPQADVPAAETTVPATETPAAETEASQPAQE